MVRLPRFLVAGALMVLVATGCGGGKSLKVVVHPNVRSVQLPSGELRELRRDGALRLSPSQVAFMTTGGISCVWWPKRLTVLSPSAIRIDMRVNGALSRCGSGATGFPIAVKIDSQIVNAHHALTVRLGYKVDTRQWDRTVVAPAIRSS